MRINMYSTARLLAVSLPLLLAATTSAFAQSHIKAQSKGEALKPHTVLNFDGRLVEAVNQRPLDSYSLLEDADKNRRGKHLYDKRANFHDETAETIEQMRYTP